ncbi:MAG: hypothetical protein IPM82_14755 [Saprospiraceae bacterium]|nr:hypothetical protein [Saprospiraceae bacterium]
MGDDAQSIYAFRGRHHPEHPRLRAGLQAFGIRTFKLEQIYRSTEHIVRWPTR